MLWVKRLVLLGFALSYLWLLYDYRTVRVEAACAHNSIIAAGGHK
jgi:hypothetical protein